MFRRALISLFLYSFLILGGLPQLAFAQDCPTDDEIDNLYKITDQALTQQSTAVAQDELLAAAELAVQEMIGRLELCKAYFERLKSQLEVRGDMGSMLATVTDIIDEIDGQIELLKLRLRGIKERREYLIPFVDGESFRTGDNMAPPPLPNKEKLPPNTPLPNSPFRPTSY